jgi:hypothetical protein
MSRVIGQNQMIKLLICLTQNANHTNAKHKLEGNIQNKFQLIIDNSFGKVYYQVIFYQFFFIPWLLPTFFCIQRLKYVGQKLYTNL